MVHPHLSTTTTTTTASGENHQQLPQLLPQPHVMDLRIANRVHEESYWNPIPTTLTTPTINETHDNKEISQEKMNVVKKKTNWSLSIMYLSFLVGLLATFYLLGTNISKSLMSLVIAIMALLLITFILTYHQYQYKSIVSYAQKIVPPAKQLIHLLNY